MYRLTSPREVWEKLEKWHMPQTQGEGQELYEQLTDFKMTVDDNMANVLKGLEEIAKSLATSAITIPESRVYALLASLLPPECEWQKEDLR